ncbi:response regulator [Sulfurimonas marina]|uniref:Response regulator n=1 Tax=Sulfurimonas marina TaxID=2590551 RepID=A0A7M3V9E2_9BACT|nr:response regulator [Sulfurimonas marina]QOP40375.1 response regulator [Sulfurimonas marina]
MKCDQQVHIRTKNLKEKGKEIDILVVEDDEVLLSQLVNLLKKFFNRVDIASNGIEALNRISERDYDLIITDLVMPLLDGFSLIENIRKEDSEQLILVLSGYSDNENLLQLINMGIDGFLPKPVNIDVVMEKLHKTTEIIYNRKALKHYMKMLEESHAELLQRDSELEETLNEMNQLKLEVKEQNCTEDIAKELMSAEDFAKLYIHEISYLNEEFEILEEHFNTFLLQEHKSINSESIGTIVHLLQQYCKHLEPYGEFAYLQAELCSLAGELAELSASLNIEFSISSFVLLFDHLEQLRKGVFVSQSFHDIHKLDKAFIKVLEDISNEISSSLELVDSLVS